MNTKTRKRIIYTKQVNSSWHGLQHVIKNWNQKSHRGSYRINIKCSETGCNEIQSAPQKLPFTNRVCRPKEHHSEGCISVGYFLLLWWICFVTQKLHLRRTPAVCSSIWDHVIELMLFCACDSNIRYCYYDDDHNLHSNCVCVFVVIFYYCSGEIFSCMLLSHLRLMKTESCVQYSV